MLHFAFDETFVLMPTIRDFTSALRRRAGVEAVLISGSDGLLIEGFAGESLDRHDFAARIPSFVSEAARVGDAAHLGACATCIVEFENGYAIVSAIAADTLLTVLATKSVDLGSILFDIRSQRSTMGALV